MRSIGIILVAASLAAGCSLPQGGSVYSRNEVRQTWNVAYGEVVALGDAIIEGRQTAVGRVGGGFVGYEVGRSVGGGSGSDIAGAVGAVAGAVAGEAVEEQATRQRGLEITVDLEGGRTIMVVQAADQSFAIGERVRVYTRGDGAARVARL
jgi:outer membrane lipoprotein SlyB